MIVMLAGLLLWSGAHLFKRLAPGARAGMGNAGMAAIAVLLVLSVVLMVIGYRSWFSPQIWNPPGFLTHVNNLLMLLSVYLYAASGMKTAITRVIRHPQLTAVKTWAVAHLLVNGDLASVVLFGGLLVWAVVEVIVINRATRWVKNPPAPAGKEIGAVIGAVLVTGLIGWIHTLFNLMPFGG
jgi:uncharacterized membrane protein